MAELAQTPVQHNMKYRESSLTGSPIKRGLGVSPLLHQGLSDFALLSRLKEIRVNS